MSNFLLNEGRIAKRQFQDMAQAKLKEPKAAVERNLALSGRVMQYLLDHPQLLEALPENFELVVLPDDDPEMRLYNLALLDTLGREDKTIVFVRIQSGQERPSIPWAPKLYVPIAA